MESCASIRQANDDEGVLKLGKVNETINNSDESR